jgi:GT2 family glycosyltransferase
MNERLSIILITYNRPDDLLELLQSLRRQQGLALIKEVLILNNASTVSYQQVESFIQENPDLKCNYIFSTENLGVSRGRNKLMKMATGELLVVLDDDVLFPATDALEKMAVLFQKTFFEKANTGIITFKVIYYETKQPQQTALPHKQFAEYKDKPFFLTYYFTGCAHLLKKEVLDETGFYPEDFFYGMEEYDLSYRIINAGYTLGYDNSVLIEHKESPKGRQPNYQKLASQWINKSKVAWRYLPKRYYITTMCGWSLEYIRKAKGNWGIFFSTWIKVLGIPFTEKRTPISKKAITYLKQVKARLWY